MFAVADIIADSASDKKGIFCDYISNLLVICEQRWIGTVNMCFAILFVYIFMYCELLN